jgi:hypothetical protein
MLDQMLMVRYSIDDMDISEIPQPLAWKVGALKTPGYLLLLSAPAEPVFACSGRGE